MQIKQYHYDGEGMSKVYVNDEWMLGIKNWKPENDRNGFTNLERHNETDELFVLLEGECTLVYGTEENGQFHFGRVKMVKNKLYNIPKGLWHNTITEKDTKLVLMEASDTSMDNSEIVELSRDQINEIQSIL
ncbi:mannose-6-phosphate isomerase-like protein (cupin superfamily) [Gracilibacillus halotolerans]|uniref:Mannose-6-phosphate isomerase-like protein (Cupin superfamily) n=1 Tax=Gracilibacillus halotolerans TaxID=74386 RepID=A0A841RNS2_9BACI|nr:cupin domain-containing protein [Gracilibacillus halotolerans]MBB6512825.1 mannose-6-phosphate isomerase-like protein (cupin superfamily) [Gracilibacillus halotolerans]